MHTRTLTLASVGTALGIALVVLTAAPTTRMDVPPCPTEDSTACYWDAERMGNGTGRSYTVDVDGTTHYWEPECHPVRAFTAGGAETPILGHWC